MACAKLLALMKSTLDEAVLNQVFQPSWAGVQACATKANWLGGPAQAY